MRHVFPTREIPHKWAHQAQDNARNAQGNLYFRGATIYSYRDSWPLAHIHHDGDKMLVLTNTDTYSSTTTGHQSMANRAVSHMNAIAVRRVNADHCAGPTSYATRNETWHVDNIAHLTQERDSLLAKAQRCLQVSSFNWRVARAQALYADELAYREFFKVRGKKPVFPAEAWDAACARVTAIENPDPVRDAKRFKERERRQARREAYIERLKAEYKVLQDQHVATMAVDIQAWRDGGKMPGVYARCPYTWTRADRIAVTGDRHGYLYVVPLPCMLRVNGDQIETSQGARIPLEHAPRIWALVSACVSAGREYKRNGHTEHAGSYAIDSVSADGTMRAGCHTIAYGEIKRLAVQLGYAGE